MDVLFIVFFLGIAIFSTSSVSKSLPVKMRDGVWVLLAIHILTAISYYFFIRNGNGDAWTYWIRSQSLDWGKALSLLFDAKGTYFIHGFNYFFSGFLGMGFFANTCVYALLGFFGVLYYYRIAIELVSFNSRFLNFRLFPLLFYLPMLHFWSSGIGKDSLLFWSIGMFAYGLMNIKKRFLLIVFALLFAYLVRPHISLLLLVAFGTAYLMDGRTTMGKKLIFGTFILVGVVMMLPTIIEYTRIEEVSVESIADYSQNRAANLSRSHTGSSIDISSYPPPLKWFTFLFRPLFFDINGIPALVASFENLFFLLLFLKVLRNRPVEAFRKAPFVIKGLTLFLILGTVMMSGALGNLGIIVRMRNMFLPGMMIYFLWVLSYAQERRRC